MQVLLTIFLLLFVLKKYLFCLSLIFLLVPPECQSILNAAVTSLKGGHVIALPTDTIYGVAALAQSTEAVSKLYQIKKRHEEKPVAICVGKVEDVYK